MTINYLKPVISAKHKRVFAICGFALLLTAPLVLSAGALPSADDLGLGGDTKPAEGLVKYAAWGVKVLAYVMMIVTLLGAGGATVSAFVNATGKKGGMGEFFSVLVTSIVMASIVVSIGLIAVKWADGLATIQVTRIDGAPLARVAKLSSPHAPVLLYSNHA
ncbi:MAG: hypothetical protein DSZ28_06715 [Thiothrix sp.]|nr:MAG: hypothetical protein DSZ28_06715 [Thiothrix sp.]